MRPKSKIKFVTQEEIYGNSYEDIPRRVPDNTKMRTLLGVTPKVGLREGMKLSMDWFRKEMASLRRDARAGGVNVALKIDVDTHQGLGQGVPRLAAMLEREQVAASFYIAMGPDNSGRAICACFEIRGFISKMFRTKAVSMYGAADDFVGHASAVAADRAVRFRTCCAI